MSADPDACGLAAGWAAKRVPAAVLHLDAAAAGRASLAVQQRIAAHLAAESRVGAYVAEAEVAQELHDARAALGSLVGFGADELAFVESGSAALAQLLIRGSLHPGSSVWVTPSEWGANLLTFERHRLDVELLRTDDEGHVDVPALRERLGKQQPAMVHLVAMAAHRALAQPVAEIVDVCAEFGVPVVVDAAQALGHVVIAAAPAAVYGTGRKYLRGPRGVAYVGVRASWRHLLPAARDLENVEASIASRVGFAVALQEQVDLGAQRVANGVQRAADDLRRALTDLTAWRLGDPVGATGGIVTLLPPVDAELDIADVVKLRAQLLARGVLTSAVPPSRSPHDMTGPVLRLSPHVDVTPADVATAAALLHAVLTAR